MSLSDYISIFDTRPIAQSHLSEAATATPPHHVHTCMRCWIHVHVDTCMDTYVRRFQRGTRRACTSHRGETQDEAQHGTARHARPLFAEPHLTLPAGSADADVDSDAATAAAVRPLSRACTHMRVRTYIIKSRLGDLDFGAGLVAQYSLRAPARLARLTHGIFWRMSESKTRTPHLPSSRDVRGDVR